MPPSDVEGSGVSLSDADGDNVGDAPSKLIQAILWYRSCSSVARGEPSSAERPSSDHLVPVCIYRIGSATFPLRIAGLKGSPGTALERLCTGELGADRIADAIRDALEQLSNNDDISVTAEVDWGPLFDAQKVVQKIDLRTDDVAVVNPSVLPTSAGGTTSSAGAPCPINSAGTTSSSSSCALYRDASLTRRRGPPWNGRSSPAQRT